MKKTKNIILHLTLALCFANNAYGFVRGDVEQTSIDLINANDSQKAFEILSKEIKTTAQDWFLYGSAAQKSGHLIEAEAAFKKAKRLDPQNAGRIKLELASVSYALGANDTAEQLLNEVKADNPPPAVRQNIDRFLAIIGDQNCHTKGRQRWCINASAEIQYDSNVNNATTSDTVTMFGLPFTLSDDAKAQSDIAYKASAAFDHIVVLSDTIAWQSNLGLRWTDYSKLDQFDTMTISASTGAVFQLDDATRISVPVSASAVIYTDKGDLHSTTASISPQLRRKLNDLVSLNLNTDVSRRHYISNGERDTTSYYFAPSLDFSACGKGTFRIGARFGRDLSGIDTYSNRSQGIDSSINCSLTPELVMNVYGSYLSSEYETKEAAYSQIRNDRRSTVGASLHHSGKGDGLSGTIGMSYTSNDSNLTLYEYEKLQFSASIKKKF